jgi:predicted DNA-binding transcriptional regulator AlpA
MQYINFRELRARLGNRARASVYNDVAAGRLPPPQKLSGKLYWPEEAIDARLRELAAAARTEKET